MRIRNGGGFGALEKSTETSVQKAKQRERSAQSVGATDTHYSETLVRWLTALGGDWILRLGLWSSNPGEWAGVRYMKTA